MRPNASRTEPEPPGNPPRAFLLGLLTLAGVLLLALIWEFALEDMVLGGMMNGAAPETARVHWEFVVTSVVFAALAMTPPLIWLALATRRERSARQALDQSRQQIQTVVEAVSEVIWEMNSEGKYTYISENVSEALGVSVAEVLSRGPLDFIAPEQRAEAAQRIRDATSDKSTFQEFELEFTRPDGSTIWLAVSGAAMFSPTGEPMGHRGVARDVSARKRADEALAASATRYRHLVETTHDLIWSVDAEGCFTFVNRNAAMTILGYQPEEMLGRSLAEFKTPEQAAKDMVTFATVKQGQPLFNYETSYRHKDGSLVPMMFNAVVLRDAGGNVIGTTGTAQNISERQRREENSRARQAELAHVHRLGMMGEMATELAHELNQPLAAIMNYAFGCSRRLEQIDDMPTEIHDAVTKILGQAERAGEVIRRMRGFARRREPERKAVDLNAVIDDTLVLLEVEARRFAVAVELDFATALPAVWADPIMIQQVILNLARNGMEAMVGTSDGQRQLVIGTAAAAKGGVRVSVRDRGPGLPSAPEASIFEPFFTTKVEGTGLGLSFCSSILEDHGGRLEVDATGTAGTSFVFTLPAAADEVA